MRSISPATVLAAWSSSSPMAEKRRRLPTRWKISTAIRRSLSLMWWLRADCVMPRASAARVSDPCRSMATSMRSSLTSSPVATVFLHMRYPHELAMNYEFQPEPGLHYLWAPGGGINGRQRPAQHPAGGEHLHPAVGRRAGGGEDLAARGPRAPSRAGDPRDDSLSQARRHDLPRPSHASLDRGPRLCLRPCRYPRQRRIRGAAERRVSGARAAGWGGNRRVALAPALVQRQRRHDGHFLGWLQFAPGRSAQAAGAEGDHHPLLDRRPLCRRYPLHGWLPDQRAPVLERRPLHLGRAAAGPPTRR